jgi:hypothetical protein
MAKVALNTKGKAAPPARPPEDEKPKAGALVKGGGAVGALPAHLAEMMEKDAEKGVSKLAEDNIVPLIYILQSNSPTVNERRPEYIKGAKPGMIWLRNAPSPLVDGETGFVFQACYAYKDWVEWRPNRQGYAGRHDKLPEEAEEVEFTTDSGKKKKRWVLPNGNVVVETRYRVGFVMDDELRNGMPYVIPFSSSGHTVAKTWNTMAAQKMLPSKKTAALFAYYYRLTLREKSNADGTWFVFDVTDEGWVSDAEGYNRGLALHNAFASGAKVAENMAPDEDDEDDAGDDPNKRM